jgi:predicted phage tail protein
MNQQIWITAVTNPFDPPQGRVVQYCDWHQGLTVRDCVSKLYPMAPADWDIVASINGQVLDGDHLHEIVPPPGCNLVFCPVPHGDGGKDLLRAVAMVAVMIGAWQFGGWMAAPWLMAGETGMAAAIHIGTAALVSLAGSTIVNAILPPPIAGSNLGASNLDDSPTYAWSPKSNTNYEGAAIAIPYGTFRVAPYLVSRHITTEGDDQYLNLLYAVADCEVDAISDVKINDNASANYDGVDILTRLGEDSQSVIPYFNDTINEKVVSTQLEYESYATTQTDGNSVQGLGVAITLPYGLYRVSLETGGLLDQSVYVDIEYKKIGDAGWTAYSGNPVTITAGQQSAVRKLIRIDDLDPDQYDVRATLHADPPTGTRYRTTTYLEYIQEIVYDDFLYPGTALLAVRALATNQLSGGEPRVTCLVTRSTVQVHNGSDWVSKPADNPAWVAYDMLVNARYGGAVSYTRVKYDEFETWAAWCVTKSLECNIYFDQAQTLPNALSHIEQLGRGRVVQRGTDFGCVIDKTDTASQMFGMGNIVAESFELNYIGKTDRMNVVEITYFDADLDYEPQIIELHQDDYDSDTDENRTALSLYGCTARTLALKHGKFLLNCNKYLIKTISFEADIDAIAVVVGDVIKFSHDVPQWGTSGRVVSATADTVTIDRQVTLSPGTTSKIMVRHLADDTLEEQTIAAVVEETTTDELTLSGTWTTTPSGDEIYAFGASGSVTEEFRVIRATRSQEGRRKITALQYDADVYDDTVTLPDAEDDPSVTYVNNLAAVEYWRLQDGIGVAAVELTWRGSAILWNVFYRPQGFSWKKAGSTSDPKYNIYNLDIGKTYDFAVTVGDNPGDESYVSLTFAGRPDAPEDPENVAAAVVDLGFSLTWDKQTLDPWVLGYDIALDTTTVEEGYTGNNYLYKTLLTAGSYTFKVRARDAFGQTSGWVTDSVTVSAPDAPGTLGANVIDNNVVLLWSAAGENTLPVAEYEIRGGLASEYSSWADAPVIGRKAGTFTVVMEYISGTYTYWVAAIDTAGNYGSAASISLVVNEPAGYVLKALWENDFDPAPDNTSNVVIKEDGTAVIPANPTETIRDHCEDNSLTGPKAFHDAGYTYLPEPVPATASFDEEFDYGADLENTRIRSLLHKTVRNASPTITAYLAQKLLPGDSYTDQAGNIMYASDFRYVRAKWVFASNGKQFVKATQFDLQLDVREVLDGGAGTVAVAASGCAVTFNKSFIDVDTITITPQGDGSAAVMGIVDFEDTSYPTGFTAYLLDETGSLVTGEFFWSAKGY